MQRMITREKLPVTKVVIEGAERMDTLYVYGHDVPAVAEALCMAFGQPGDNVPIGQVRKKRRIKRAAKAGAKSKAVLAKAG